MPARAPGSTATATAPSPAKFTLPVLEFNFSSLTEGTDIPPPLPSPIQEEAPEAPPKTPSGEANGTTASKKETINGAAAETTASPSSVAGKKRSVDEHPSSPTLSTRPGSIRRLFSRNMLNNAYEEGAPAAGDTDSLRPESRTNGSFVDSKKAKRSSGWFGRLRGDGGSSNKRASVMAPQPMGAPVVEEKRKPSGPPPPMIPELSELKSKVDLDDGGSLGGDLFKDIK